MDIFALNHISNCSDLINFLKINKDKIREISVDNINVDKKSREVYSGVDHDTYWEHFDIVNCVISFRLYHDFDSNG